MRETHTVANNSLYVQHVLGPLEAFVYFTPLSSHCYHCFIQLSDHKSTPCWPLASFLPRLFPLNCPSPPPPKKLNKLSTHPHYFALLFFLLTLPPITEHPTITNSSQCSVTCKCPLKLLHLCHRTASLSHSPTLSSWLHPSSTVGFKAVFLKEYAGVSRICSFYEVF